MRFCRFVSFRIVDCGFWFCKFRRFYRQSATILVKDFLGCYYLISRMWLSMWFLFSENCLNWIGCGFDKPAAIQYDDCSWYSVVHLYFSAGLLADPFSYRCLHFVMLTNNLILINSMHAMYSNPMKIHLRLGSSTVRITFRYASVSENNKQNREKWWENIRLLNVCSMIEFAF